MCFHTNELRNKYKIEIKGEFGKTEIFKLVTLLYYILMPEAKQFFKITNMKTFKNTQNVAYWSKIDKLPSSLVIQKTEYHENINCIDTDSLIIFRVGRTPKLQTIAVSYLWGR